MSANCSLFREIVTGFFRAWLSTSPDLRLRSVEVNTSSLYTPNFRRADVWEDIYCLHPHVYGIEFQCVLKHVEYLVYGDACQSILVAQGPSFARINKPASSILGGFSQNSRVFACIRAPTVVQ